MNWKIITNPFEKYSEKKLLMIGLCSLVIGIVLQCYPTFLSDDEHVRKSWLASIILSAKENFLQILFLFTGIFIISKIINKKTRAIDVLNLILIAKIPKYLSYITIPLLHTYKTNLTGYEVYLEMLKYIGIIVFNTLFFAVTVMLLYNGFRVATNTKKWHHYVLLFSIVFIIMYLFNKYYVLTTHTVAI